MKTLPRILLPLMVVLALAANAFGAFTATTVWESRAGAGASSNGGGFDPSFGGTDYSQQNAAQATGTVTSASTTVTATTGIFTAAMVGNIISDGTTYVQITAYTSSTIVTVDSAPSWTAATVNVGGATSSIVKIAAKIVAGNTVWVKNTGTDTITSGFSFTAGTLALPIDIRGYNVTRGDLDDPIFGGTITATHNVNGFLNTTNFPLVSSNTFSNISGGGFTHVSCLNINGSNNSSVVSFNAASVRLYRCSITNSSSGSSASCFFIGTEGNINDCNFSSVGASGGSPAVTMNAAGSIKSSLITSTNSGGITFGNASYLISGCIIYNLSTSQIAMVIGAAGTNLCIVENCTFNNIPGTCITLPNSTASQPNYDFSNNQVTNCGTFLNNLRSGTQKFSINGGNNRIRNTTTPYTGFNNVTDTTGYLPGDITTAQTDAAEYVNASATPPNLNLTTAAAGYQAGLPAYISTGALQPKSAGGTRQPVVRTGGN